MDENKALREKLTEKFRAGHFVFVPFGRLPDVNGLFIPVSERVIMNINDFYPTQGKFGLHHFAFMKLADAAGVNWGSERSTVGRTDGMTNPNFCSFRVVAKIRTTEGLWSEMSANKHMDLDAKKDAIEIKHAEAYDYKAKFGGGKGPTGYAVKKPWPETKDEYVKKFTDRDLNQLRENMDERCESGAQVRAIKNLMHIPSAFDADQKDSSKPAIMEFHIVRYILDPHNNKVQQAQLLSFQKATADIYGSPPVQVSLNRQVIAGPKDITPKEAHADESIDTELIDFENLSHDEKVRTIESLITSSKYEFRNQDVKANGAFDCWAEKALIDYFKHLNAARKEDKK